MCFVLLFDALIIFRSSFVELPSITFAKWPVRCLRKSSAYHLWHFPFALFGHLMPISKTNSGTKSWASGFVSYNLNAHLLIEFINVKIKIAGLKVKIFIVFSLWFSLFKDHLIHLPLLPHARKFYIKCNLGLWTQWLKLMAPSTA